MIRRSLALRGSAVVGVVALLAATPVSTAGAMTPPKVDTAAVPADGSPAPERTMELRAKCATAVRAPGADPRAEPPSQKLLNLSAAQKISNGAGVSVAVIDTGVHPDPRLPRLRGIGDYVGSSDGLQDCNAHGTLIAGIIGAQPSKDDAFVGVAPGAEILSIRGQSASYQAKDASGSDSDNPNASQTAYDLRALGHAIVHAANNGARVINVSLPGCVAATKMPDVKALGAAAWYATVKKDALVVAAAGNVGGSDCQQNPEPDSADSKDRLGWSTVANVSLPSYFSEFVLSVAATTETGGRASFNMHGPWIGIAAPGTKITSLNPTGGGTVNAVPADGKTQEIQGTSFAAAYVSGVAALVRSKYPQLTATQVRKRLQATAHQPPGGIDNVVGFGLVDPVAALSFEVPPGPEVPDSSTVLAIAPPPTPVAFDSRPRTIAAIGVGVCVLIFLGTLTGLAIARKER